MSILQNSNAISAGGYDINNSLRFRSSASAYLNRTPASASNRTTWTWSGWVKRGALGVDGAFFDAANNDQFRWRSDDTFSVTFNNTLAIQTTQVFRDPSSWYHFVVIADTTQATASNRIKLYVNGVQVTAFSTASYPAQNTAGFINSVNAHNLGRVNSGAYYIDGYMAEVNFIDGQALTPSSFGETDTITGSWVAKKYTGTYGTNGFYLKFSDIATTSGSNAGLGKDFSGNGNYWTTNNISVTSGTTYDAMTDSPTNTSATVANYPTLNPLVRMTTGVGVSVSPTISNGNLTAVPTANNNGTLASFGVTSGKWYFEVNVVTGTTSNNVIIGITYTPSTSLISGGGVGYEAGGNKIINGTSTSYGSSTTTGDVIGVALDADASTVTFYKNNTSQGSISYTNSGTEIYPSYFSGGGTSANHAFNFGQRPFSYTPPTGFNRLNTYNLPDSTIKKGNKYMDATLYTGNTTGQTITNAGAFKPDFVWLKDRTNAYSNVLTDSVRGVSKQLFSNLTNAETTEAGKGVTSFNSNGFTLGGELLGTGSSNNNGDTYVGWQWQAGQGSTSNITVNQYGSTPSIASTVSVNATAGFSVVTYTGVAGNVAKSFGHGLGVAPSMVIVKDRDTSVTGTSYWTTWQTALGLNGYLHLNTTDAKQTNANRWGNALPTSTVVSVGGDASNVSNESGHRYVAYCWAEIAGFSKFGSYTGNGSADGPMIFTGFKPKFVMFKRTDTTSGWYIHDSTRNTSNVVNLRLLPNTSDAEATVTTLDFLSNGFKLRTSDVDRNASGGTYIYAAFAENPFKNSLAR